MQLLSSFQTSSGITSHVRTAWLLQVGFSQYRFYWTPPVKNSEVSPTEFSEGRARQHVKVLSEDIGGRQVGSM